MPSFSSSSMDQLLTCHLHLQRLFNEVVKDYDCKVIEGHRSPQRQLELYRSGASKVKFGQHNKSPSLAVDVGPYIVGRGIPWPRVGDKGYIKDLAQFYHFAGYVEGVARELKYEIRWGGDWDRDHDLADQKFDDLVHFELRLSASSRNVREV